MRALLHVFLIISVLLLLCNFCSFGLLIFLLYLSVFYFWKFLVIFRRVLLLRIFVLFYSERSSAEGRAESRELGWKKKVNKKKRYHDADDDDDDANHQFCTSPHFSVSCQHFRLSPPFCAPNTCLIYPQDILRKQC